MDNLILKNSSLASNTIHFNTDESSEILRLCPNGDIFVKGKLVENDKEVVTAMREFLKINNL
jgi:hypothetical protein